MALKASALPGPFGTRIDVRHDDKLQHLSDADREMLRTTFANNSVTLIRGCCLDPESHLRVTRLLGEPAIHPVASIRLAGHPEIIEVLHLPSSKEAEISPCEESGQQVGHLAWHADLMYMPRPSHGALLRALEVPEKGGETAFVDTTLAYDRLDDSMKRFLRDKKAAYQLRSDNFRERNKAVDPERFSEVLQPIVHHVPGTDSVALNISPAAKRIEGLDEADSAALIHKLLEYTTQEQFSYVHTWLVDDIIIWNNLRTLHSARGHDPRFRRVLHRTTLEGPALDSLAIGRPSPAQRPGPSPGRVKQASTRSVISRSSP